MRALSRPTIIGIGAIAIWATLALFTAMTGKMPPFLTTAICFALGGLVIISPAVWRRDWLKLKPTLPAFLLGLYGPFGDTVIYFAALKLAPPAEANLIHYLWPLLIVLFAAMLPGGGLRPLHLIGALMGLGALLLLVGGKLGSGATEAAWWGYGLALLGAVVWSSYSVLSRLVASSSTESLGVTILIASVMAYLLHRLLEAPYTDWSWENVMGLLGLGLGSQGLALICWDIGMKRGDVSFLGVASYATPVLSTVLLVVFGFAPASLALAAACALIVTGAMVARKG
ncbi:MAG: EamA family transporter [Methylobacterium sp.]|nr:EamA family transporter [Methylobacterium sp.]